MQNVRSGNGICEMKVNFELAPDERNINPMLVHKFELLISVPVLSTFSSYPTLRI